VDCISVILNTTSWSPDSLEGMPERSNGPDSRHLSTECSTECDEEQCESSAGLVPTRVQIPIPSRFIVIYINDDNMDHSRWIYRQIMF